MTGEIVFIGVFVLFAVVMGATAFLDSERAVNAVKLAQARDEGFREGVAAERARILKLMAPKPRGIRRLVFEHVLKDADDEYLPL
jgi:hypothetical protein